MKTPHQEEITEVAVEAFNQLARLCEKHGGFSLYEQLVLPAAILLLLEDGNPGIFTRLELCDALTELVSGAVVKEVQKF